MEPIDATSDKVEEKQEKPIGRENPEHFDHGDYDVSGELGTLANFAARDKDLFSRALNALFSSGFILNQLEKDKPLYRFLLSRYPVFETYLGFADWSLRKDESLGVIALTGPAIAKHTLNLDETIGLLVLRVLYEDKRIEISLAREISVRQYEFQNKFKVLSDRVLNKTRLVGMLRRFRTLKLISIRGEETDPEAILVLYPSIAFTLDGESIDDIMTRIGKLTAGDETEGGGEADAEMDAIDDVTEAGPNETGIIDLSDGNVQDDLISENDMRKGNG
jgi:hypothetical protein